MGLPMKDLRKYLSSLIMLTFVYGTAFAQSFEIRGVLPWHNFLSGPSAWNEEDYREYLDECAAHDINFIAFHNYTGGGERYFNYVEPMVKISYKNVLPEAGFDNGSTARWGYLPMALGEYPFGTSELFKDVRNSAYFGADCSVDAKTSIEVYDKAQALMTQVLKMAHERDMQMAMGFEFGVAPPEYASIRTNPDMYWMGKGSLIYNPFDPDAAGILYATIDNILETYQGIDWIYLWLNEHCMFGIDPQDALNNELLSAYYDQNVHFYEGPAVEESLKFLGVWSQAYIQKAYDYIKRKSPETKIVIGGWGSENQMAHLLKGLHQTLPRDIVFSMLNPQQGEKSHPDYFKEIARERKIWAIPWLEGDASLWHLQPRVHSLSYQVQKARADQLDGVVAIHWRTEELRLNFETYAGIASNPADKRSTLGRYRDFCDQEYGSYAAEHLAPLLAQMDTSEIISHISSPVYFAYQPAWGRLNREQLSVIETIHKAITNCIFHESEKDRINNLQWLSACFKFTLLLDEVSTAIEPAWNLRSESLSAMGPVELSKEKLAEAKQKLEAAPIEQMIRVFSTRIRSRGELGELSSIIQRVWGEYVLLSEFLQTQ